MDAVEEYKERRKARLGAKAIEKYKARRDARLNGRMDDDEETNNQGGHGNTKIPFGLCQREGISIDPKWTPKDAWNALEGKGYSAGQVYKELKDTGKVGGKKKEKTKLSDSHFPQQLLTSTYRKNTMEFAKYVNDHCEDDGVSEFLSCSTMKGGKMPRSVKCRRTSDPNGGQVSSTIRRDTREILETQIDIPNLSKIDGEAEKKTAMMSFAHEWTHFIDLCARENSEMGHFSGTFKPLKDAISNDNGSIGAEASKIFKEFNEKFEEARKEEKRDRIESVNKYIAEKYPERPSWIKEDGSINYWEAYDKKIPQRVMNDYNKAVRKIHKDVLKKWQLKRESLMDGASSLQGIYDSLNGGELRASGKVKYGHSTSYFRRDSNNKAIEMIADWVALKAFAPQYAKVFADDKPEVARELDNELSAIVKKMRGD